MRPAWDGGPVFMGSGDFVRSGMLRVAVWSPKSARRLTTKPPGRRRVTAGREDTVPRMSGREFRTRAGHLTGRRLGDDLDAREARRAHRRSLSGAPPRSVERTAAR